MQAQPDKCLVAKGQERASRNRTVDFGQDQEQDQNGAAVAIRELCRLRVKGSSLSSETKSSKHQPASQQKRVTITRGETAGRWQQARKEVD